MVYFLKTQILRCHNSIHNKFRWGGEYNTLYLLDRMSAFTLEHMLLWGKYNDTYAEHDADSIKWINSLLISSSTDELNIQVDNKF